MSDIKNGSGFKMVGDHRDIPLALGLVVIAWNSCELGMRDLIRTLCSGGDPRRWGLVEVLVSELGTLGIAQAIQCYAKEVPDEEPELAQALKYIADASELLKTYRNYYVHGIRGVTGLGFFLTDETIESDATILDVMQEGPFANIYQKSAKGRQRFIYDFIKADSLIWLNNQLADLDLYIREVSATFNHYLKDSDYRQTYPLPALPHLPDALVKPELRHRKLKRSPALVPPSAWEKRWRELNGDEEPYEP